MSLTVLYPYPGSSSAQGNVDIIAVHGLNGNDRQTWTHDKSNALWLEKFLPRKIPDARVLAFGYNADVVWVTTTTGVHEHAQSLLTRLDIKRDQDEMRQRPIIFVAHSLGGIIVKEAIRQAREDPRYASIFDSTLGIMFFGTPHHGSPQAKYGEMLAKIVHAALHKPDSKLLDTLNRNSDALEKLNESCRFLLPKYQLVSFYETRPVGLLKSLVVDAYSAKLQVEHEVQIPIDKDHIAMCKFEDESDETFEMVCIWIQRMRRDATKKMSSSQPTAMRTYNEPPVQWWKAPDGSTPMHTAAQMGDIPMVDRLRREGHSVGVKRNDGSTPMHVAASFGQIEMVNHLGSINAELLAAGNNIGMTPIHEAARNNQFGILDHLRSLGQPVNARRHDGSTPMHAAAYNGHKEMVDYLNSLGVDLGVKTNLGMTPIHEAANNNQIEMLDHLRARGQSPGVKRTDGSAPMHVAAFKGHIEMVDHLRDLGQDLGVKNNDGMTPIHEAANNNQIGMFDHLLRLGQDMRSKTKNGSTPMDVARSRGNTAIVEHIRSLG